MSKIVTTDIDKHFEKLKNNNKVKEALLLIEDASGEFTYNQTYKRDLDTPMLLSSVTKLFTATCLFNLMEQGKLRLNDKVIDYLEEETIERIHVYKGIDYTHTLTLRHLLFQTSGLPDFFLGGGMNSLYLKIMRRDLPYTFEEEIKWVSQLKPRFSPGTKKKAYYSDVNFDLLGKIIEVVNESTLEEAFAQYIFEPLLLTKTYLPQRDDMIPHSYHRGIRMNRPMYIRSRFASGGGVSTARELMVFVKAFWKGELFNLQILRDLTDQFSLQTAYYPVKYSAGYMYLPASRRFGKTIPLVGYSGSAGAFAFYSPEQDLFYVGDIPQVNAPNMSVRFVSKVAQATK